jgi:hypothetical protein
MKKTINLNRLPDSYLQMSYPDSAHRPREENFDITYSANSDGYRSAEFKPDPDSKNILTAGCSMTYGEGLPFDKTWPEQLKSKINGEVLNLSSTGRSFYTIIDDIYAYIEKYGKPKAIMILFPEHQRYQSYSFNKVKERILASNDLNYYKILQSYTIFELNPANNNIIKDDKNLAFAQLILSYTNLQNDFMNRVFQLEKYLEAIDVPFMYTSWDEPTENFFWLSKKLKCFFPYTQKYKNKYVEENFDSLVDGEEDLWLEAADRGHGHDPHPGILFQKSFANAFYKEAIARFGEKIFN